MNPVGDGREPVVWVQRLSHLAVTARHTVGVAREEQAQRRHVEHAAVVQRQRFEAARHLIAEDATHELEWKAIVAGGHRRVRREYTLAADRRDVVLAYGRAARPFV